MKRITELWTPVLLNNGIFKHDYLVSNMGRVKQKRYYKDGSYQFVLMTIIKSKRPIVRMKGNGKSYVKSVAKLVLSSFNYREGCECANITYLDGNMDNCALSNLRYTADKPVYETIKREEEAKQQKKPLQSKKKALIRSCSTCIVEKPCFPGMENLSSDFGAEGCRRYKPIEDN